MGYLRIVGECRKLDITMSATSVRTILRDHRRGPAPRRSGPSWTEFPRALGRGSLLGYTVRPTPGHGSGWQRWSTGWTSSS